MMLRKLVAMNCTRCEGSGFINGDDRCEYEDVQDVIRWISENADTDMQVCDCCGDSELWYGEPGVHYTADDQPGPDGPYAYNGGLCECH